MLKIIWIWKSSAGVKITPAGKCRKQRIEVSLLHMRQLFQFGWTVSWSWNVLKNSICSLSCILTRLNTHHQSLVILIYFLPPKIEWAKLQVSTTTGKCLMSESQRRSGLSLHTDTGFQRLSHALPSHDGYSSWKPYAFTKMNPSIEVWAHAQSEKQEAKVGKVAIAICCYLVYK